MARKLVVQTGGNREKRDHDHEIELTTEGHLLSFWRK
jgi:hypothetical protein